MSGAPFKRMEGMLVDIVRQSWQASMPEKEMVAASITEGVRQAFLEYLSSNPLKMPEGLSRYRTEAERATSEIDNAKNVPARLPVDAAAPGAKPPPSATADPATSPPAPVRPAPSEPVAETVPAEVEETPSGTNDVSSFWDKLPPITQAPLGTLEDVPAPAAKAPPPSAWTLVSSAKHGPTRSSDQVYITFRLESDTGKTLLLKFYWSGTGKTKANWELLFAVFLRRCGVEKITNTGQLHGRKIHLNVGARTKTLAGLDSVSNALGYQL